MKGEDRALSSTKKGAGRGGTGKCGCAIRNMGEKPGAPVYRGTKGGETFQRSSWLTISNAALS